MRKNANEVFREFFFGLDSCPVSSSDKSDIKNGEWSLHRVWYLGDTEVCLQFDDERAVAGSSGAAPKPHVHHHSVLRVTRLLLDLLAAIEPPTHHSLVNLTITDLFM